MSCMRSYFCSLLRLSISDNHFKFVINFRKSYENHISNVLKYMSRVNKGSSLQSMINVK